MAGGGKKMTAHEHQDHHAHMVADFKKRFWISLVITVPVLILSPLIQGLLGIEETIDFGGDTYVLWALSSVIFFYGGLPFLKGLYDELKSKTPGMMTLIALAIILFILEIKVTSYGALTIGGVASLVFGSLMLYDTGATGVRVSLDVLLPSVVIICSLFIFGIVMAVRAQGRRTVTGREGLVGALGEARTELAPRGRVFVHGEIWEAVSRRTVAEGQPIRHHVTVGWGACVTVIDDRWWMNCKIDGRGVFLYDMASEQPFDRSVTGEYPDVARKLFAQAVADAGGHFPDELYRSAAIHPDLPGSGSLTAVE